MKCEGLKRNGEPCGNTTRGKNRLCFWHAKGEQAKSKRDVALNLRVWTPAEMALVLQRETRRFIRDNKSYTENQLAELRKTLETIATFTNKKFQPLDNKGKKSNLSLSERIAKAEQKSKQKEKK